MKRFFLLFICSSVVYSCTPSLISDYSSTDHAEQTIITKGSDPLIIDEFFVSDKDVFAYIRFREFELKKELKVSRISSIPDSNTIPAIYIINYDRGWDIISADKRTKPRLAYDSQGSMDWDNSPDTQRAWLTSIIGEVDVLRNMSEQDLDSLGDSAIEEMNSNIDFWDAITANESFLLRVFGDEILSGSELGYYELDGLVTDTLEYNTVNHLINLHWHQQAPYNNYCPLRTDITTQRAPAGCGAVAAGQILWYLHTTCNYPVYAPDSAYVSGNVNSYTMTQSGQSSTIWPSMQILNSTTAGILLAKIGTMVGMQYSNTGSSSYFTDYRPNVFVPFGVNCNEYYSFYTNVASQNLLNGLPVFVRAATANGEGHFFIIDGYKAYREAYGFRYVWVSTDPSPDPQTIIEPEIHEYYSYGTPFIQEYSMNWGWGISYDNGWYSTTGSWTSGGYSFDYGKMMLADFSEIQ